MQKLKTGEEYKNSGKRSFIESEKERTMKLSIKEGTASAVMSGLGDSYVTPFAVSLNATNVQVGFLSSFSSLIPPIFQMIGNRLTEKYSRKGIIFLTVALQAFMWIPISLLVYLFWKGILLTYLPYLLIAFYSIYAIFGALAGPAWFSMMGDVVPEKIRGRYFAKRNRICGTISLFATLIGGFFLDYFKTKGLVLLAFSILFLLSFAFRMFSAFTFPKYYDPKIKHKKDYYFSFWQFLKKSPSNNFGRFVIFVSLMYLATNLVGPFFTVYMLRDLHFSYVTFMFTNLSASVMSLLAMPFLGKISDRYGNRELLKIGSILVPIVPFLWLFSTSPWFIIIFPQFFSGVGWAAFGLASSNFIYDTVTPQRRAICVSYFSLLNGIGVFIGATAGGLISTHIPITFMNSILFLAVLSGVARFATLFLISTVKEVKPVKKPKSNIFLYIREMPILEIFSFSKLTKVFKNK